MGVEQENTEQRSGYQRLRQVSNDFISNASSAQELSDRFEYVLQSYIFPAFAYAEASFERRPVATVFSLVFLALSLVPFLTYAIVSCAALSTYTLVALLSVLTVSIATLLTLSTILLSVLFGIGILTTLITATIVSGYLVLRLALLVRQEGFAGAAIWVSDIQKYVLGSFSARPSNSSEFEKRPPSDVVNSKAAEYPVKKEPHSDLDTLRPDVALAGEGTA